jgi:hypothetical protein
VIKADPIVDVDVEGEMFLLVQLLNKPAMTAEEVSQHFRRHVYALCGTTSNS